MKYVYCLAILLLPFFMQAQRVLKGIVREYETNTPVPGANVFFNNTSIGIITNAQGQFELQIPAGKFDLIVSSVGFNTYNQTISTNESSQFITIKLQPKMKTLEAVVVEPYLKDGWDKWGRFFLENFIGISDLAKDCQIKNSGVIRFRHSKQRNELTAHASELLIIENKSLGYTIHYQLENFTYDFKNRYVYYQGYPFFTPMKSGTAKQNRWSKKREEIYEGSMLHFMRSLYRNQLVENGFSINYLKKLTNTEKLRVKELYAKATRTVQVGSTAMRVNNGITAPTDSLNYYNTVMRQPDVFDVLNKTQLTGDSVAYAIDSTTAGFYFDDYLLVVYKNKMAPVTYQKQLPHAGTAMMSQITLIDKQPIEIEANGAYYHPANLLSSGYWGWSEKIATMLPFDYKAPNK